MPLDPVVWFFLLGLAARLLRSDLKIPGALYEALAIYLLLAIGLRGGVELAHEPLLSLAPQAAAALAIGVAIPLAAYPVLRYLGRLSAPDAGAIAAHYGSVSVVTFAVATAHATTRGIPFEATMPLMVALLEVPGILVGVMLGRAGDSSGGRVRWGMLTRETLVGKSVVLLVGGVAIGWLAAPTIAPLQPFFVDMFKGVLCLFLLEMGLVVGARLGDLRRAGPFLIAFGVVMPLAAAVLGAFAGRLAGFSVGGTALLATLAASASYIAAPAATRIALPKANPALSLGASLGVTFPFNIAIGIPLYFELARRIHA